MTDGRGLFPPKIFAPAVHKFLEKIKDLPFPQCFECKSCPLLNECFYTEIIKTESKIQTLQMQHPIDQGRLDAIIRS